MNSNTDKTFEELMIDWMEEVSKEREEAIENNNVRRAIDLKYEYTIYRTLCLLGSDKSKTILTSVRDIETQVYRSHDGMTDERNKEIK